MAKSKPARRNYRNATGGYGHWSALDSLGPVVYALQLDGGIVKIGFTTNLADRRRTARRAIHSASAEVLAFTFGTHDDEQAIHSALVEHRAHGREYYYPHPAVLAVVNEMRDTLGLPHLAA